MLLNRLAHRAMPPKAKLDGSAYINDVPANISSIRATSSYVEQQDHLIGSLTTSETMKFAAKLGLNEYAPSHPFTGRHTPCMLTHPQKDQSTGAAVSDRQAYRRVWVDRPGQLDHWHTNPERVVGRAETSSLRRQSAHHRPQDPLPRRTYQRPRQCRLVRGHLVLESHRQGEQGERGLNLAVVNG